jgi:choline-sulfatase
MRTRARVTGMGSAGRTRIAFGADISALVLALVLGLDLWSAGCARPPGSPPVILVSIDTCRPDRLGCYGQPLPLTPSIDELAQDAVLFTRVTAAVPLTLPSHCTMLTGTIPPRHGVHDNAGYRLEDSRATLAEVLQQAGYQTGAIVGSFALDHRFGLSRGFDSYDDEIPIPPGHPPGEENERPASEVTRSALAWLDGRGSKPFFLFVHYYDPHAPYAPPEPFASRFREDPYGGEVAAVDEGIGRILERLKQRKIYDRALVIVTSDHGEALGEHGESAHGYFVYDSALRVPLLVKPPRARGGSRSDRPVGLVDLVPTICAYAGVTPPAGLEGEDISKVPAAASSAEPRAIYFESLTATKYDAAPLRGVVSGRWKYILSVRPELYDLRQDPAETVNLLDGESATVARLNGVLQGVLAEAVGGGATAALDQETRERLASLGYITGRTVNEALRPAPGLADAKDRIAVHETFQNILGLTRSGDFAGARRLCERITRDLPSLPEVHLLAGDVEVAAGRPAEAVPAYRRFLDLGAGAKRSPVDMARGWFNLGNALAGTEDRDGAVGAYRKAVSLDPKSGDVWFNLGVTLAEAGGVREAADAFGRAAGLDPANAEAQFNLGLARSMLGDQAGAVSAFEAALKARPAHAGASVQLARLELAGGNAASALARLRSAMAAHPERPEIAWELAWILATHQDARVRNGAEAERIAQGQVSASGGKDPQFLELLAAAKAEQGRYEDAAALQERALALVPPGAPERLRAGMAGRLALYRQGRPARTGS